MRDTEREAYITNKLERECVADVVERVKAIAFSYATLHELTEEHYEIETAQRRDQPGQVPVFSRLSSELRQRENHT